MWKIRDTLNEAPSLSWFIISSVLAFSNGLKRCMLLLNEKLAIPTLHNQDEILNTSSELTSKWCHANKSLLYIYKSSD